MYIIYYIMTVIYNMYYLSSYLTYYQCYSFYFRSNMIANQYYQPNEVDMR